MSHPDTGLIERFNEAFQKRDAEAVDACYADDVVFSDPHAGEKRPRCLPEKELHGPESAPDRTGLH
jgi:ketosteroid isomerase-like protein